MSPTPPWPRPQAPTTRRAWQAPWAWGTGQASVLERVYKFPGGEQISIFQSAPLPTLAATNAVAAYSPLWRHGGGALAGAPPMGRVLKSEEELLAAEERGDVVLEQTEVVVNCPVTRAGDGSALRGVR
jgi:hypothetical protein